MKTESVEEFLNRGGKITKGEDPIFDGDSRSDFTWKDKVDVAKKSNRGANKRFNQFVDAFLGRGNNNWKYKAKR